MPTHITAAEVRRTCGIPATDINDTDVNAIIDEVEDQTPRFLNTKLSPTETIDFIDGNDTNRIFTTKLPLLKVKELRVDTTDVTIADNLIVHKSGEVRLDNTNGNPEVSKYISKKASTKIKYLYGWVEETSTSTATTADASAGSSVALAVSSETGFSADDWVEVYGMDGYREIAQVTGTDTNEITVDSLVFDHESGSTVVKMDVPETIKRLMRIVSSISMVARIVGESADDTTGYTLGELSVQKGEPYTQWRETANQLIAERKRIMQNLQWRATQVK